MGIYLVKKPFVTINGQGQKCYPKPGDFIDIRTRQESAKLLKEGRIAKTEEGKPQDVAKVDTLASIVKAPSRDRTEKPPVDTSGLRPGQEVLLDLPGGPVMAEVIVGRTVDGLVRVKREDQDEPQDIEADKIVEMD